MHSFVELLNDFCQPSGATPPALPPGLSSPSTRPSTLDILGDSAGAGRAVLDAHRQRFALSSSPVLDLVDSAIVAMVPDLVEPSVKLDDEQIFAERVNLYFYDQARLPGLIGEIFAFYDRVRAQLGRDFDDSIFASLIERGLRLDACRNLVMGLDIRPDPSDSRLKLYFLLDEPHTGLVERFWAFGKDRVASVPRGDALAWLVPTWTRLFGLDFGFDGASELKIYAGAPAFAYSRLHDSLGLTDDAAALMHQAPFCMLSLLDPHTPLQLLLPGDVVLDLVAGHGAGAIAETIERRHLYVLSVDPDQVATGRLDPMNLYYADTRYSGGDTDVFHQ